jgi:DNA-binding beta-propeller fold protein YncE
VQTIAGTGQQDRTSQKRAGPSLQVGLNSPWGLLIHNDILYIAMAGHHQIWVSNLKSGNISPLAGTGEEELKDGLRQYCAFAQPSGLASDGTNLYIADCEVSAIRTMALSGRGMVSTIVGAGLFEYGDINGVGPQVRLQHALDVQYQNGKLYVADTYNHKIKLIDPARRTCTTFAGDTPGTFDEPSGLSIAGNKLYVADTGAHRIRIIYTDSRQVTTLELTGVDPVLRETAQEVKPEE